MRAVLSDWWGAGLGPEAMAKLRELFRRKLAETREAVRLHQQLERELEHGLAYLETCRACDSPASPVDGCVHCTQDHGMKQEPALVAGIITAPGTHHKGARPTLVRIQDLG
jgi:hypothetical protein